MLIRKYQSNWRSSAKLLAQDALNSRCHYVTDDTLRFHKSRVLDARVQADGLLFSIVESYAVDYENSHRLFRPVIFDMFGHVVNRVSLEDGYGTSKKAQDALDVALDTLDPIAINRKSLESYEQGTAHEIEQVTKILEEQNR